MFQACALENSSARTEASGQKKNKREKDTFAVDCREWYLLAQQQPRLDLQTERLRGFFSSNPNALLFSYDVSFRVELRPHLSIFNATAAYLILDLIY